MKAIALIWLLFFAAMSAPLWVPALLGLIS